MSRKTIRQQATESARHAIDMYFSPERCRRIRETGGLRISHSLELKEAVEKAINGDDYLEYIKNRKIT